MKLTSRCGRHMLFLKNRSVSSSLMKLLNLVPSEAVWMLLQCLPFQCGKSVDPLNVSYSPDMLLSVSPVKNVSKSPVKSYIWWWKRMLNGRSHAKNFPQLTRSIKPTLSKWIQWGNKVLPSVVSGLSYPIMNSLAVILTIGWLLEFLITRFTGSLRK